MKIFEIGTGYTSIPAQMGAATEIVVEELTRSMLKINLDVNIIDIHDSNRAETDLPIIDVSVPNFITKSDTTLKFFHKMKRVVYSLALMRKLCKIIKQSDDDKIILHFHNQYNLFFFLLFAPKFVKRKVKIAYTIHSYIWQSDWNLIKGTVKKKYFQEVYCSRKADFVFVLNSKTKETFTNQLGIDEKKIIEVLNGVNTNIYKPFDKSIKDKVRKELGIEQEKLIVHAGSICDRKNQLGALHLLKTTLQKNPDVAFVYAGGIISADYKTAIDSFVAENHLEKQVYYAGELKPGAELNKYYAVSSALLFPSKQEGFSLVVLEAMSAGLPVILDKKSGLKLPERGGSCCFQYDSPEDFDCILREIVFDNNRHNAASLRSRALIEADFSWDKIVQDYVQYWV